MLNVHVLMKINYENVYSCRHIHSYINVISIICKVFVRKRCPPPFHFSVLTDERNIFNFF